MHAWCTNHNEDKYASYGKKVEKAIKMQFPDFKVIINQPPPHLLIR